MTAYIEHPRLKAQSVEARAYQIEAAGDCLGAPTLLVLPTGLGKTAVEWMVISERLHQHGGRAVIIAPTNALVNQHLSDLHDILTPSTEGLETVSMTGSIDWKRRAKRWATAEVIVATPQVIRNDVQRGSISLNDVTVLVIDEAHHATGNHAAGEVGELYLQTAKKPLILGATASPGSSQDQVEEVCRRLGLKRIHSRGADNPMVSPYSAGLKVKEIFVDVDEGLQLMANPLSMWLDTLVDQLRRLGYHVHSGRVTSGQLNDTRGRIQIAINRGDGLAYNAARKCAQAQRLLNLIGYLLSQGVAASREYLTRVKNNKEAGDKGATLFFDDGRITELYQNLQNSPELHRKVDKTVNLVLDQIEKAPESRVIVFAHFRDTVNEIVKRLDEYRELNPVRFVGQSNRDGNSGMTQKEQIAELNKFRAGEYNVLVATSVGEEGLDVPSADCVIFYEPVGSEIRTIQRRGRTGRHDEGAVHVLIARITRDEGARASALYREKKMKSAINKVRRKMGRADSKEHCEILKNFKVREGKTVGKAFSFLNHELERLAPELGEQRQRIKTTVEHDGTHPQDNPQTTVAPQSVNPSRLRPKGQTGLDSFPSSPIKSNITENEKQSDSTSEKHSDVISSRDGTLENEKQSGSISEKHSNVKSSRDGTPENDKNISNGYNPNNNQSSLEKLSIRAAEDIVQALTTAAIDPLAHESDIPCRIVIDHRELNTTIAANLRLKGVDVDVQTLPLGDFQIGDRVLIERKRVRDFVDSLLDGRLLEQAHRLIGAAPRPLLLIEGGGLFTQSSVHHNALMGALATLSIDLGLPIVTTQDGEETARFLIIAARREQALLGALTKEARIRMKAGEEFGSENPWFANQTPGGSNIEETAASRAATSVIDSGLAGGQRVVLDGSQESILERTERERVRIDKIALLESLPGVGPTTAKRLLAHFTSIEALTQANIEEVCQVSGIGPSTAKKIVDILR